MSRNYNYKRRCWCCKGQYGHHLKRNCPEYLAKTGKYQQLDDVLSSFSKESKSIFLNINNYDEIEDFDDINLINILKKRNWKLFHGFKNADVLSVLIKHGIILNQSQLIINFCPFRGSKRSYIYTMDLYMKYCEDVKISIDPIVYSLLWYNMEKPTYGHTDRWYGQDQKYPYEYNFVKNFYKYPKLRVITPYNLFRIPKDHIDFTKNQICIYAIDSNIISIIQIPPDFIPTLKDKIKNTAGDFLMDQDKLGFGANIDRYMTFNGSYLDKYDLKMLPKSRSHDRPEIRDLKLYDKTENYVKSCLKSYLCKDISNIVCKYIMDFTDYTCNDVNLISSLIN